MTLEKRTRPLERPVSVGALFAPYVLALTLWAPLLITYLAMATPAFEGEFFSKKWDSLQASAYALLAVALFAAGAFAGDVMARRPPAEEPAAPSPERPARLKAICLLALGGALLAYGIWFARGVANAGGVRSLFEAFADDPDFVRNELLTTLPGVTTLTQLAVAAVPLAIAYRLTRDRLVLLLVGTVLVVALAWSIFASQRFTFLELFVPAAYLAVAGRRASLLRVAVTAAALVGAVTAFFLLAEIRRRGAYDDFGLADAVWRFTHYYLGSINNAAAVADHGLLATPFFHVTQAVWEFPLSAHVGLTYEGVTGFDARGFHRDFARANVVSPAINTYGVIGEVAADFGWAGLLWILGLGGLAGALYRAGERAPFYRALYAVWLVGILEFLRIYFFFSTRVVPAYLVFATVYVLVVRNRAPRATPQPARAAGSTAARPGGVRE